MASGIGGGTCVLFVKEKNYVFTSCDFVPVVGVKYLPGICWQGMYVFMFYVSRKQACGYGLLRGYNKQIRKRRSNIALRRSYPKMKNDAFVYSFCKKGLAIIMAWKK
jgi:hypothetical protein